MSRVGGAAQIKAMKKVAGRLRIDLAQYRALEAFAQLGSELDRASQQQLARGARVVEILKQPQYDPQPVERQVVAVSTVTGGHLDEYPVDDAKRFMDGFLSFVETRASGILTAIKEAGDLSDETEQELRAAIAEYKTTFVPSGAEDGGAAALAGGTKPDEVREDVGWDRMSSVDDDDGGGPTGDGAGGDASTVLAGSQTEAQRETRDEAGPVGEADAPAPPG